MSEKLYPPYIDGVLPALNAQTNTHTISFQNNRAINLNAVSGMAVKLVNCYTNAELANIKVNSYNLQTGIVSFTINDKRFGQSDYYQIQLAYISKDGTVGYYSTVGTVKVITPPVVKIANLNPYGENLFMNTLIGECNQPVYTYRFVVLDGNNEVAYDTGMLRHLTGDAVSCTIPNIEDAQSVYYEVTTVDNYTQRSPRYQLAHTNPIVYLPHGENNQYFVCDVIPQVDRGSMLLKINYVKIDLEKIDLTKNLTKDELEEAQVITPIAFNGLFNVFRRSKNEDNILICQISMPTYRLGIEIEDFSIAQGVEYTYSLQQVNKYNLPGQMITFDKLQQKVSVDFEDIFLIDEEHILKVRYNPKVSSFKSTIQESKIETLGSKYPFVFRNGVLNYKEFPIEGLISYHMDNDNLFYPDTNDNVLIHRHQTPDQPSELAESYIKYYDLNEANIAKERDFKLNVLNWLNNGQSKIFKSATEGNYIVQLIQVSLTPNDTLGRMLHTFKANAFEVAEYNSQEYNKFNACRVFLMDKPDISRPALLDLLNDIIGDNTNSKGLVNAFMSLIQGTALNGINFEANDTQIIWTDYSANGQHPDNVPALPWQYDTPITLNTTLNFPVDLRYAESNIPISGYPYYFIFSHMAAGTIIRLITTNDREFSVYIGLLNSYVYNNIDEPIKQISVMGTSRCSGTLTIYGFLQPTLAEAEQGTTTNISFAPSSEQYNYLKNYSQVFHVAEQYIAPLASDRTIILGYDNATTRQYLKPIDQETNELYKTLIGEYDRPLIYMYKNNNTYYTSSHIVGPLPTAAYREQFPSTDAVINSLANSAYIIQDMTLYDDEGFMTVDEDGILQLTGHGELIVDGLQVEEDGNTSGILGIEGIAIFRSKDSILELDDAPQAVLDDALQTDPRQEIIEPISCDPTSKYYKAYELPQGKMVELSYYTITFEFDTSVDGKDWFEALSLVTDLEEANT